MGGDRERRTKSQRVPKQGMPASLHPCKPNRTTFSKDKEDDSKRKQLYGSPAPVHAQSGTALRRTV